MPLVFASICPHPPIIIPSIGKENLKLVNKTKIAMEKLEEEFYASKPEMVVVISPHSPMMPEAFSLNMAESFSGNFQDFGDFTTKLEFRSDKEFSHKLKERCEDHNFPLIMYTNEQLDHGVLVPLYYLTKHTPNIPIVPISFSLLDYQTHHNFGKIIMEQIQEINKRVAVVASGDLSHRLTVSAPAGYSPQGRIFDDKLVELIKKNSVSPVLGLDQDLIEEAGECGLRSIVILLGVLNRLKCKPQVFSYEGPFGVGYLVANYKL